MSHRIARGSVWWTIAARLLVYGLEAGVITTRRLIKVMGVKLGSVQPSRNDVGLWENGLMEGKKYMSSRAVRYILYRGGRRDRLQHSDWSIDNSHPAIHTQREQCKVTSKDISERLFNIRHF